jgi:2-keto-3-deoxy-L-rhamnonate aldolase
MTAKKHPPPTGVWVPVPTFFKPATDPETPPDLDLATQIEHAVHLARSGIRGIVLLGSTGEAIHLSRSERQTLISSVRQGLTDAGFPGYPLMAGVLVNAVEEAIEWLSDAEEAGADWGLVLAPGYFGPMVSQEAVREWYEGVAARSGLSILIYHYPGVTNNVAIAPETYTELARHPNIVGCKMSHGNVSHHVQVSLDPDIDHENFRVFSGFGQQCGPIVMFGAAGVVDGLAAIYPKTVVRLMELSEKRPITPEALEEAQRLQFIVSRAEEYIGGTGIIGIREGIHNVLGLGNLGAGRLPLVGRLPAGEWEKWSKCHKAINQIERSL